MKLSVVVPVYNQEETISKTIDALLSQSFLHKNYEVIMIDDGSVDETFNVLKNIQKKNKRKIKILKTVKKHGRGAARNLGIGRAENDIIVLIDGDIIVTRNFLEEHFKWHTKHPEENFAMVGQTTWSPELKTTSFMNWLEHGGRLVDFDKLKPNQEVDYKHFYTGNTSFKRKFLIKNGLFDENFERNIFEDLELAYRLKDKGLKIFYNPNVLGYHFHQTDPAKYAKRMIIVGKGAKILFKKHPELKNVVALTGYSPRTILNQVFSPLYFLAGKITGDYKWIGYYYNARFFRQYLKGLRE